MQTSVSVCLSRCYLSRYRDRVISLMGTLREVSALSGALSPGKEVGESERAG